MTTPAAILSALLHFAPVSAPDEIARYQTIADAVPIVAEEFQHRWRGPKEELIPAMITAMLWNGPLWRGVHSGERVGSNGARCLMDIDRGNPLWKNHVERFEDLGGLSLGETVQCMRVGTETLVVSLGYCLARRYRTNLRPAMWSMYATGSKCWIHRQAKARSRTMGRVGLELGR